MDVALFVTCLVDLFRPTTGQAAVAVLERHGAEVECPTGQTCCGQFAYNAGYRDDAVRLAQHFVETFATTRGPIIALSGSCAAMVRTVYPELLAGQVDAAVVRAVAERVQDFAEWYVGQEGAAERTAAGQTHARVALHVGCHMRRMLGAADTAHAALEAVGTRVDELPQAEQCCGFGGTYAMTEPAVSTAMADAKLAGWRVLQSEGAAALVSSDWGCLLHLAGRLARLGQPTPALHLAEWVNLAEEGSVTPQALAQAAPFSGLEGTGR